MVMITDYYRCYCRARAAAADAKCLITVTSVVCLFFFFVYLYLNTHTAHSQAQGTPKVIKPQQFFSDFRGVKCAALHPNFVFSRFCDVRVAHFGCEIASMVRASGCACVARMQMRRRVGARMKVWIKCN
jgi:hypothetical protein